MDEPGSFEMRTTKLKTQKTADNIHYNGLSGQNRLKRYKKKERIKSLILTMVTASDIIPEGNWQRKVESPGGVDQSISLAEGNAKRCAIQRCKRHQRVARPSAWSCSVNSSNAKKKPGHPGWLSTE